MSTDLEKSLEFFSGHLIMITINLYIFVISGSGWQNMGDQLLSNLTQQFSKYHSYDTHKGQLNYCKWRMSAVTQTLKWILNIVSPSTGCCVLYLLLCHSATKPCGNNSGEESVRPAKLSLPGERCATTNPWEEMVGLTQAGSLQVFRWSWRDSDIV